MHWHSFSAEDTARIAQEFARHVVGGDVVVLMGDLGAGKTTFTQAFAAALGVTSRVKSPTYTVLQEYPLSEGAVRRFVHMDLYRFRHADELSALELEEYRTSDTVMMIEWPERVGVEVLHPQWIVQIAHRGPTEREISVRQISGV
jgi:tRNA threonylcarbamoyladenosine biosynthesis protein TsaE